MALFQRIMTMDSPGLFAMAYQQLKIKIQGKIINIPTPQQTTEQNTKPPTEG